MQSLFARYIKEREGKDIIELENGFATYQINGESCYIEDIYVVPEARHLGVARAMGDAITEIARERGCKFLLGTVSPSARGSTYSLAGLLQYGFILVKSEENQVTLLKEIK